eukprot:4869042-Amphidinium_carterae.1
MRGRQLRRSKVMEKTLKYFSQQLTTNNTEPNNITTHSPSHQCLRDLATTTSTLPPRFRAAAISSNPKLSDD